MDSVAPTNDNLKKLRSEVYAYPTDLRRRFELGAALFSRRKYHEAIPELQKGMMNPHVRWESMKLLIDAYEATSQSALAASMREQLSKESGDEGSSGSAPVPAPTRPISPRGSARAKKSLDENDAV
jgi:hypothetical protein